MNNIINNKPSNVVLKGVEHSTMRLSSLLKNKPKRIEGINPKEDILRFMYSANTTLYGTLQSMLGTLKKNKKSAITGNDYSSFKAKKLHKKLNTHYSIKNIAPLEEAISEKAGDIEFDAGDEDNEGEEDEGEPPLLSEDEEINTEYLNESELLDFIYQDGNDDESSIYSMVYDDINESDEYASNELSIEDFELLSDIELENNSFLKEFIIGQEGKKSLEENLYESISRDELIKLAKPYINSTCNNQSSYTIEASEQSRNEESETETELPEYEKIKNLISDYVRQAMHATADYARIEA